MTRIAIDADVLGRRRTGDETYVVALLRELAPIAQEKLYAITRRPDLVPAGIEPVELAAQSQILRMTLGLPRVLRKLQPDLAHFLYAIPPGYRGPTVLSVHDISFERLPGVMGFRDALLFRTQVRRSVKRADRILTGSERTKRDLIERYDAPEERIVVTPYGVDSVYSPVGARRDGHYVLFVGAIQPRKDPVAAIEALALLNGDLRLVMVGSEKRGGDEVRAAIARLGLEDRVELTGHVERDELATLYRGAACLVYPSRYEGFGFPVLEAMASGAPVVTTRAGAIPEVAGDAAVLVEPGDPVALAGGIKRALADRERLVEAGLRRARRYSWAETAQRTLDVYLELT